MVWIECDIDPCFNFSPYYWMKPFYKNDTNQKIPPFTSWATSHIINLIKQQQREGEKDKDPSMNSWTSTRNTASAYNTHNSSEISILDEIDNTWLEVYFPLFRYTETM